VVVFLLAAAGAARADNYTWNNPAGGNWDVGANWSPALVPGGGDNATINLDPAGISPYGVLVSGTPSVNNLTINSPDAGVIVAGTLNLGGTALLTRGQLTVGAIGQPGAIVGGTITRGAGGTGTLSVYAEARLTDTLVDGNAVAIDRSGPHRLRMSGTARFTAGSTVTFAYGNGGPYSSGTGITYESGGVVDDVTFNLGVNTTLGAERDTALTLGANARVNYHDPNFGAAAVFGREFYDGNGGLVTLTNNGLIRCTAGELYVGRMFDLSNAPANVNLTNSRTIEAAQGVVTMNVNTFTNAPGGEVRAADGGQVFLFGRFGWVNQGTLEVRGDGSTLLLGGLFTRDGIGTVVRSGANTIGIYAGWMDNAGGTWALTAATGSYHLFGQEVASSGRIIGGAITAAGGAKLLVRPIPGGFTGIDYCRLTGVAVGPGVLDFSAHGGKVWLEDGTTLAAGDTITLAGNDTAVAYFQTQQVDGLTFVLSGDGSAVQAFDNNTLTLGPTTVVRKTGTGMGHLNGGLFSASSGGAAVVNRGLVHVQQGALRPGAFGGFVFTNRGTVQVDAGATWQGPLATDGGTVRGGGTVDGSLTFAGIGNELRPGASPGTLTVTGNLTLNPGTTLFVELDGAVPGAGHDRLAVTGTVTLADATLAAALGGGYVPAFGDKLFIVTNEGPDAIAGTFAGLGPGAVVDVGGYYATISYAGDVESGQVFGGNDIVLYNFVPVPEPAAGLLAAAGLAWVSRRRRRPGR
jgi:hypothetical protein